jgi:hypothetical protein
MTKNKISTNTSTQYSPLQEMKLLSQGKIHEPFLSDLNGKNVDNQAKLFLAAQARNELQRIIRLTEFLDNIENKFMTAVNKKLVEQPDNINLIMTAMDMTTQSLKRSQELIYNVLKDDSLQTLVVNTVNLIPGTEQSSIMSRKSRDAIRSVATKLISDLQAENIVEQTVIDIDSDTKEIDTENEMTEKELIDSKLNELLGE